MAGEKTLLANSYPDHFGYVTCTILEDNLTSAEGDVPIFITDRDIIVDSISFMANVDDSADLSFLVRKADSGTAPSGGTAICTALTDTVGAYTTVAGVVDTANNVLTAGQYLALDFTDSSESIDILHVTIRFRTRRI
tara:strand:- start:116 stop:526 length:411 start_codon:yes stop_codon:yes gene_type:complete